MRAYGLVLRVVGAGGNLLTSKVGGNGLDFGKIACGGGGRAGDRVLCGRLSLFGGVVVVGLSSRGDGRRP